MPQTPLTFFAICPRGLEALLALELETAGATALEPVAGGVAFSGDAAVGYRANLHSRIASRILRQVNHGRYRDDDDIYKIAARTPWEQWLTHELTLRVDVNATRSPLRSLNFATLRVKDGIVDRLREQSGERPSIDTAAPDARVFAYLDERNVTLYLDWSGESLFKRGWRSESNSKGLAPLKENLAAGLLQLASWTPATDLIDPFCGSGTIVIEAAQIAAGIAPGLQRSFGFERLNDFDAPLWHQLRTAAEPKAIGSPKILGSDIDAEAIDQARTNLQRAGLSSNAVRFEVKAAQHQRPAAKQSGMIVTNPPFGERMALQAADARGQRAGGPGDETGFAALGAHWKQHFVGWRVNVLSSDRGLPVQLGLKERRKTPVFNGALDCRLFSFDLFERAERAAPHLDQAPRR